MADAECAVSDRWSWKTGNCVAIVFMEVSVFSAMNAIDVTRRREYHIRFGAQWRLPGIFRNGLGLAMLAVMTLHTGNLFRMMLVLCQKEIFRKAGWTIGKVLRHSPSRPGSKKVKTLPMRPNANRKNKDGHPDDDYMPSFVRWVVNLIDLLIWLKILSLLRCLRFNYNQSTLCEYFYSTKCIYYQNDAKFNWHSKLLLYFLMIFNQWYAWNRYSIKIKIYISSF